MIFKYFEIEGRRILQGDNLQYDSFIMSQRGQSFEAIYNAIATNPEHEIVIHEHEIIVHEQE